jgi:hypothetical protein
VSRRDGKVQLGFDVVEPKLHALEFRAAVACNLPAKAADAQRADYHAEEYTHREEQENQHREPGLAASRYLYYKTTTSVT